MTSKLNGFSVSNHPGFPFVLPDCANIALADLDRGFLPNVLTTTQRDAIVNPLAGLLIYNTTTTEYEFYNGSEWTAIGGDNGLPDPGDTDTVGILGVNNFNSVEWYFASKPSSVVVNNGSYLLFVQDPGLLTQSETIQAYEKSTAVNTDVAFTAFNTFNTGGANNVNMDFPTNTDLIGQRKYLAYNSQGGEYDFVEIYGPFSTFNGDSISSLLLQNVNDFCVLEWSNLNSGTWKVIYQSTPIITNEIMWYDYNSVPIQNLSYTSYTIQNGDGYLRLTSDSPITITIPESNGYNAFSIGQTFKICQAGTGSVTIAVANSDDMTLNILSGYTAVLSGQYAVVYITKVDDEIYDAYGDFTAS